MGLFDKIFQKHKARVNASNFFKTLTGYAPVFTSFDGSLYEQGLVRACINAKATHSSKLKVELMGQSMGASLAMLEQSPNAWQTWSKFLYRTTTILEMQNNAFIVPIYDERLRVVGIYTVDPLNCSIVDYEGEPWLRYQFTSGDVASVELSKCGLLNKFQYKDDFFGESNEALRPTIDLIEIQNQGIKEGVQSAATYRFMARATNFAFMEDLKEERKRFNEANFKAEDGGGLLLYPNTYDNIQQIQSKPFVVDAQQMDAIERNVFNYFGINQDILQNKAIDDTWSAFYEGAIEPLAIQLSEVLTSMLYSFEERRNGGGVTITSNRLQYMSNKSKLDVSNGMGDRGLLSRDEIREIWNLPPLPNGMGKTYTVRGEYYLLDEEGNIIKKDMKGAENE